MIGAKEKSAFSLIEVMVSVSLFVVILMSSTEIFRLVIAGQRDAIANQNVQESLKYFFEVTGKEMRMAKKNEGVCPGIPGDKIFVLESNAIGDVLKFKNFYDECVTYSLEADGDNQRFRIERARGLDAAAGFITPNKIRIESLQFVLDDVSQPAVTVALEAFAIGEDRFKSEMSIQTTITSRYYK